jgi:hypothetical protein
MSVHSSGLLGWLRSKLTEAENALRAREQGAIIFAQGDDASWASAARMHPSTANRSPLTKAERFTLKKRELRIAEKCRVDVEMLKELIQRIENPNRKLTDTTEDARGGSET